MSSFEIIQKSDGNNVINTSLNPFISEKTYNEMKQELQVFLNCVKNNPDMFNKLCDFGLNDGHKLEPYCCAPIDKHTIWKIGNAIHSRIISGEMKINGKFGHWNVGFLGSRWFDFEFPGIDYIRVAFFSKKFDPELKDGKSIRIIATVEKKR